MERLGSESHLIFPVDASRPAGQAAAAAEEATEDADATLLAADDRRASPRRAGAAPLAPGDVVEPGVAAGAVHLFDPATGDALR